MILPGLTLRGLLRRRRWGERLFNQVALLTIILSLTALALLLIDVGSDGLGRLSWKFLTSFPSRKPEEAGILSPLVGSAYVMVLTGLLALPIGVGAGIYLEEYAKKNWFTRLLEVNIANLAGVPSIIYGLLGLELFVRAMRLDRSLLSGALTLTLLVLPIIIISTREALRAIPNSLREASYALGATRWQTIRHQLLPLALPGILTGFILALSRAIGETAPLITIGALTYIAFLPEGPLSPFTVLPIQIFNWVSRPHKGFHANAAAGIVVLLMLLLLMNALALWIRNRYQRRVSW